MLDYTVPGGKLNRGLSVIDSYRILKTGKEITEDEVFLGCVLGWCIEWVAMKALFDIQILVWQLQSYFLVLDDIMDGCHTRRGQPCWFRLPQVCDFTVLSQVVFCRHKTTFAFSVTGEKLIEVVRLVIVILQIHELTVGTKTDIFLKQWLWRVIQGSWMNKSWTFSPLNDYQNCGMCYKPGFA
eukprot:Gb_29810 [translate_table: standard]